MQAIQSLGANFEPSTVFAVILLLLALAMIGAMFNDHLDMLKVERAIYAEDVRKSAEFDARIAKAHASDITNIQAIARLSGLTPDQVNECAEMLLHTARDNGLTIEALIHRLDQQADNATKELLHS